MNINKYHYSITPCQLNMVSVTRVYSQFYSVLDPIVNLLGLVIHTVKKLLSLRIFL
jgi:hypothetical protein